MKKLILNLESAVDVVQRQAVFLAVAAASEALGFTWWPRRYSDVSNSSYLFVYHNPYPSPMAADVTPGDSISVMAVTLIPPEAEVFEASQIGDFIVAMAAMKNVKLEKKIMSLEVVTFLDGTFVVTGHIPEPV